MKQVFQTKDGETFDDYRLAQEHEQSLFYAWLDSDPQISVKDFLEKMDNREVDSWMGTEREIVAQSMRGYFSGLQV